MSKTRATASIAPTIAKEALTTTDLSCTGEIPKGRTTSNSGIGNSNNSKMDFKPKKSNLNLKTRTPISRTIHINRIHLKSLVVKPLVELLAGTIIQGEVEDKAATMREKGNLHDKKTKLSSATTAITVCQNKVLKIERILGIATTSRINIMGSVMKTDQTKTTIKIRAKTTTTITTWIEIISSRITTTTQTIVRTKITKANFKIDSKTITSTGKSIIRFHMTTTVIAFKIMGLATKTLNDNVELLL